MSGHKTLSEFLDHSAGTRPDHTAVEEPGFGQISYQALAALADKVRDQLYQMGVRRGDRVGIYLHKSIDSVATLFGILKCGAAYVPVDPDAPPARNAYIFTNCAVKVIVVETAFEARLREEITALGEMPQVISIAGTGGGRALEQALEILSPPNPGSQLEHNKPSEEDLAYILYTSGSTGKPKGVMLTHRDAISFVDWCSEAFEPTEDERFSSHAPFHFDLSILDIYVPIKHSATLVLIGEETGKDPARLAALLSEAKITSWYSTPSILSFLVQYGKMEIYDYSSLRRVLFAGEVFPVKYLRMLMSTIPGPRYFNLYGPTETNVCTYYEIPAHFPDDRTDPFPIGKACTNYQTIVVDESGREVSPGEEGELCVSGYGVMQGYWELPERTAKAFLVDTSGRRWYKTGDVVLEGEGGNYIFRGRRDRMVKKRGYRIELGEIEAGLYRHPQIKEAAVVALTDQEDGVRIKAFLSFQGENQPSRIKLKKFCIDNLPSYMVPDYFSYQETLPKTSTDKIDYQRLKELQD